MGVGLAAGVGLGMTDQGTRSSLSERAEEQVQRPPPRLPGSHLPAGSVSLTTALPWSPFRDTFCPSKAGAGEPVVS